MNTDELEYVCARIAKAVEDLDDKVGLISGHTQRIADAAESMVGEDERMAIGRHSRDLAQIAAALNIDAGGSAITAELLVRKVEDLWGELAEACDPPIGAVWIESATRALGMEWKASEMMNWRQVLASICLLRAEREGLRRQLDELVKARVSDGHDEAVAMVCKGKEQGT